jgi:hypothetical protein
LRFFSRKEFMDPYSSNISGVLKTQGASIFNNLEPQTSNLKPLQLIPEKSSSFIEYAK